MKITVYPAVQDLTVNPGENIKTQIQFRNGSGDVVSGSIKVADYNIIDKKGTVQILEQNDSIPSYSASSWISPSEDFFAIPSNQTVKVDLNINPPVKLNGCGYYALVYFQPSYPILTSGSAITTKIGGLINFSVQNKVCRENISVSQLNLPYFLEYGPVPISFDLLNLGDVHLAPTGSVSINNILNQYIDKKAIPEQRIFPERAKEYNLSLGKKWMVGRYRVTLRASYGSTPKTIEKMADVWIFPWHLALAIILGLIIIVSIINTFRRNFFHKKVTLDDGTEKLKKQLHKRSD